MANTIGVALGSGAARGICHIGILNQLANLDIRPTVVCGTSVGALVGAAYATGHLQSLTEWFSDQSTTTLIRHLDLNFFSSGGIADGEAFIHFLKTKYGDYQIEDLPIPFAAIACDMQSGREVWITEGSIWDAVRASAAYPGLLTPVQRNGQWLVDGGIVNPVPVSVCRALGASHVIAVNLNRDLTNPQPKSKNTTKQVTTSANKSMTFISKVSSQLKQTLNDRLPIQRRTKDGAPGILDVISGTINIMQDRITRSRLAGDPPEVMLAPNVANVGFLETERSAELIAEGANCVTRNQEQLSTLKQ
ncbi:MAG: patatin-like phospholipase family protein [Kangiellaceae bacterium]|jgi:NTE family protein|nr:patatin-like phospholipase family protein [Kangiellaceae bacterium]